MKKVIAVMVIMAVFSTTVFAAPLSVAGSLDKTSLEGFRSELSIKTDSHNDFDDLFADVQAVALTTEEAQNVEGEGIFGIIGAAIIGAVTVGIVVVDLVKGNTTSATNNLAKGAGVAGGFALFTAPLP
jgi:hypothetical protein